jgi:hypothetical protein
LVLGLWLFGFVWSAETQTSKSNTQDQRPKAVLRCQMSYEQ